MVTFTSFWPVKNSPLLVLATTTMFCVVASLMRVEASALPDIGEKWNVTTPGLGLPSDDHHDLADVIVGGHRCIDRNQQRHGVAVFGDLRQFDRNLAFHGGFAAGEFGDLIRRLLDPGAGAAAPADYGKRRAAGPQHQRRATGYLPHRYFLPNDPMGLKD